MFKLLLQFIFGFLNNPPITEVKSEIRIKFRTGNQSVVVPASGSYSPSVDIFREGQVRVRINPIRKWFILKNKRICSQIKAKIIRAVIPVVEIFCVILSALHLNYNNENKHNCLIWETHSTVVVDFCFDGTIFIIVAITAMLPMIQHHLSDNSVCASRRDQIILSHLVAMWLLPQRRVVSQTYTVLAWSKILNIYE